MNHQAISEALDLNDPKLVQAIWKPEVRNYQLITKFAISNLMKAVKYGVGNFGK